MNLIWIKAALAKGAKMAARRSMSILAASLAASLVLLGYALVGQTRSAMRNGEQALRRTPILA
ncbi:MAG TPA: hypothetical protein ENF73_01140, partial [Proteobacteria bacterium]|nr:hypothetical protein [Pseudomonadota bacterium]